MKKFISIALVFVSFWIGRLSVTSQTPVAPVTDSRADMVEGELYTSEIWELVDEVRYTNPYVTTDYYVFNVANTKRLIEKGVFEKKLIGEPRATAKFYTYGYPYNLWKPLPKPSDPKLSMR